MRRREFIALVGAAVVQWPSVVQAQQQKRRLAVIQGGLSPGDADGQREVAAFERGLNELGWKPGTNIDIDYYWPGAEIGSIRDATGDAARTRPDVVISRSTPATAAIMGTGLPIIFVLVADPVGPGFVQSIAKPGHNVTGFTNLENSMADKWLVLLKEAAPALKRVGLLFNPATAPFVVPFCGQRFRLRSHSTCRLGQYCSAMRTTLKPRWPILQASLELASSLSPIYF